MKILHWARFIITSVMVMFVISCCAGGVGGGVFVKPKPKPQQTGQLSLLFRQNAGISPKGLVINNSGNFLYVANFGTNGNNGSVDTYRINDDGSILRLSTVTGGVGTNQIILSPNQDYAYAANYGDNTISIYGVESVTGVLNPLSRSVQSGGVAPYTIAINAQTTFAYVINFLSADISVFAIESSGQTAGALTLESIVTTGVTSQAILLSVNQQHLYVANSAESGLLVYDIESTTGGLTLKDTVASGNSPVSMAMNSSGTILYAANFVDGTVTTYAVDSITGDLTLKATMFAGQGANSVTLTPDGSFLYVANYLDSSISMYKIDSLTGVPVALLPSVIAIPSPAGLYGIVSSPDGRFIYTTEFDANGVAGFLIN